MPYEKKNTDSVSIKEDRNSFLKHSDTNSYPTPRNIYSVEPPTIGSNIHNCDTNHGRWPQPKEDDKK